MKKAIPKKVVNIAKVRLIAGKNNSSLEYGLETLYLPNSRKVSNKFYKNSVSNYIYKCKCDWCLEGKLHSTAKKILNAQEQLNDYS